MPVPEKRCNECAVFYFLNRVKTAGNAASLFHFAYSFECGVVLRSVRRMFVLAIFLHFSMAIEQVI
jgi:hypothetical protein